MTDQEIVYTESKRCIIKLAQTCFGVIMMALLCYDKFGPHSAFIGEPRLAYVSIVNLSFVLNDVVIFFFAANSMYWINLERAVATIGLALYSIAFGLMLWIQIAAVFADVRTFVTLIIIAAQALFFMVELKVLKKKQVKRTYTVSASEA